MRAAVHSDLLRLVEKKWEHLDVTPGTNGSVPCICPRRIIHTPVDRLFVKKSKNGEETSCPRNPCERQHFLLSVFPFPFSLSGWLDESQTATQLIGC